jgi:hypothetical protein
VADETSDFYRCYNKVAVRGNLVWDVTWIPIDLKSTLESIVRRVTSKKLEELQAGGFLSNPDDPTPLRLLTAEQILEAVGSDAMPRPDVTRDSPSAQ